MNATLEAEYNNRALVPEHPEIFARWKRDAAAYRDEASRTGRAELALHYGASERQTVDLFYPAQRHEAPLALFIHGGYWRSLEPSLFSHVARGLNAHGVTVALAGYDLCPQVSVTQIIDQLRAACCLLWDRFRQTLLVCGHSAGGHLTACMVATDWSAINKNVPANLAPAGFSVSGVFDLTPLLHVSMNDDLRMDAEEAARVSPLTWPVGKDRSLDALAGGDESRAFLDQSRRVAEAWKQAGAQTRFEVVPGANHFTIVDPLADPDSAHVKRVVELARRASRKA